MIKILEWKQERLFTLIIWIWLIYFSLLNIFADSGWTHMSGLGVTRLSPLVRLLWLPLPLSPALSSVSSSSTTLMHKVFCCSLSLQVTAVWLITYQNPLCLIVTPPENVSHTLKT